MTAFDRVESGIPEMDKALDNIRLGDNVVWRVSELADFKYFMEPYVEQAIRDGRDMHSATATDDLMILAPIGGSIFRIAISSPQSTKSF